ncbi:DNA repair exonuclease SbcCD nuclease subunit [Thermosporothrix hazakensis]|jgi:DNA repair exonuclease SbcCD nuclease subunit|uniref:Nuclease SbcCD subunit D n=2 Tax=Thermosporothrix TaxID=768650 RepID=A0A326UAJ3_THEHA|nr:exonuclease SbcCD subunit D [Thermosporothrix hazakensis]PZW24725.1 DNA repair exonuclease SbcCD nuclease subunit [Thermosporothrix hazakensis]BBH90292.1 DNA repair protein [Thermosporothrix sp. COM3]GCE48329.1 DNA repair protein [Thermosporothrix hazakensis]
MRASFIHCADTHLGYEQYGVRERFNDFTRAFQAIVQDALERRVDFVLIAGDLFHKRAIDARTLLHAIDGLSKLKTAGIPVIAIEGNHDRTYYRDGLSWLQFLCYQQYIILLTPRYENAVPIIEPWDSRTMLGSYVDLQGGRLRVYGLSWLGASTESAIKGMAQALDQHRAEEEAAGVEYRVLLMHTGIDGLVPRIQGLPSLGQFQVLEGKVDYLALGHVHKPYTFGGWIYNPGSPETCSAEETQWTDRGYFYVQVDTAEPMLEPEARARFHHAEHLQNPRRPFLRYDLRVDGLESPQALYARLDEFCRQHGPEYQEAALAPVVLLHLSGILAFDRSALDQTHMEEMIRNAFRPLHVRIDNRANDQDYEPDEGEFDGRDRSLWHALEKHIFAELLARDNRFLAEKDQWSLVLADIKAQALRKDEPAQIAQYLREKRASLFEKKEE